MSDQLRQDRKTQTKAANFEHIEEVVYTLHQKRWCTPLSRIRTWDPLIIQDSVLRLEPLAEGIEIECPTCDCLSKIRPRKLVRPKRLDYETDFLSECDKREEVIVTKDRRNAYLDISASNLEGSLNARRYIHLDPRSHNHNHAWSDLWSFFKTAMTQGSPDEFLIVNFESFIAKPRDPNNRPARRSAIDAANRFVQKSYSTHLSKASDPPFWRLNKTDEEARKVQFKLVTMKTYLAEYDWRGELTDEQVRPWLE